MNKRNIVQTTCITNIKMQNQKAILKYENLVNNQKNQVELFFYQSK